MSELKRWHVQLSRWAREMQWAQVGWGEAAVRWRPPVNAYRLADRLVICVDLAGMDQRAISVRAEARCLRIAGTRALPEPAGDPSALAQTLALEIDYGPFERVLALPEDVDAERVTAHYRDGLLWITMGLRCSPLKPDREEL